MGRPTHSRWRVLKMRAAGKCYEELPMGPKIMVSHPMRAWCPPMDVFECDDVFIVKAAISGLRQNEQGLIENAEVAVEGNTVILRGTRRDECPLTKRSYYQMEIHYGEFECRVDIQAPFDADGIRAEYRDGFLILTIPKKPSAGARRIQVQG